MLLLFLWFRLSFLVISKATVGQVQKRILWQIMTHLITKKQRLTKMMIKPFVQHHSPHYTTKITLYSCHLRFYSLFVDGLHCPYLHFLQQDIINNLLAYIYIYIKRYEKYIKFSKIQKCVYLLQTWIQQDVIRYIADLILKYISSKSFLLKICFLAPPDARHHFKDLDTILNYSNFHSSLLECYSGCAHLECRLWLLDYFVANFESWETGYSRWWNSSSLILKEIKKTLCVHCFTLQWL